MIRKNMLAALMSAVLLAGPGGATLASGEPSDLRAQIAEARKKYFALYNELNPNPQYEMVCRKVFGELTCRPQYFVAARQKAADKCTKGFYQERPYELITIAAAWCNADRVQVLATAAAQEENFRKNVQEVFQRSPELRALGQRLEELQGSQRPTSN